VSGVLDAAASLASPWAYIVLALLAAAESAAFVGLAVPGETAMLLGGFLAFQGRVSLLVMMAAGAAGAVVGDQVGYQIGHLFGEPLKRSRLGRRVGQDRWAKGEAYLRAKGGRAVFLGRFVGLLRALVPALAGMSLTVSVLALVLAGWAFVAVLQDVLSGREGGALLDGPVQHFFLARREAWLTPLMRGMSDLGSAAVLLGLILLAGLTWWSRTRGWRPLGLLAIAYLGAWLLWATISDLTDRARPPAAQAIGHWTGSAFPAGRTTAATAVLGMLAALLSAATPHWGRKVAVWTAAVLVAGLVGVSQLYLGAHWLTDVLGALALGAVWLFALLAAARTLRALRTKTAEPPASADARPAKAATPKRRSRS
jgi:membrane protein DedA with SNARE-associated domain